MSSYVPPNPWFSTINFNEAFFTSNTSSITLQYANATYLRRIGIATSVASNTTFSNNVDFDSTTSFDGNADFNTSVNVDGITTMNNVLNMNGGSIGLSTIQTRELRLKDTLSGNNNGSKLSTTTSVLTVDSVGPLATATTTEFTLRNAVNTVITPLQLTTNINNMNVSLDMINTDVSYFSSLVRARYFNLRDLATSVLTNCGIYFSSNILQIDSTSGTPLTATSMFLRTTKADNSLTNALQLTNTTVKTDCYAITPLPSNDISNSIPTTAWVQNLISSPIIPPQTVKRAWARRTNVANARTEFTILIPDSGSTSTTWGINEMVSFRLTFNQEWSPSGSGINQTFYSTSCILNLYPYRFILGWLKSSIYTPASQYTSGIISSNQIYASSSTADYYFINPATPNSRQFWSYNIVNNVAGPIVTGLLNISGDVTNLSINQISIWVINPGGHNVSPTTQSYDLSLELLNPSDLTANITTPGGWEIGF